MIKDTLESLYEKKNWGLSVILTNGDSMWGMLSPLQFVDRTFFSSGQSIEIFCLENDTEVALTVPLTTIAGVSAAPFPQSFQKDSVSLMNSSREFETNCFVWKDITFYQDTPLYSDWDYFFRKSGGINNVGIGFMASATVGWNKSLWSFFKEQLQANPSPVNESIGLDEVAKIGYITFLAEKTPDGGTRKRFINSKARPIPPLSDKISVEMEGGKWIASVLTEKKISVPEELSEAPWDIVYFKEDAFMFPRTCWEDLVVPIKIYGDVVNTFLSTDFGKAKYFIKARAAAYLHAI